MAEIPKEHAGRFFFHFTHINNLESILKNELLCTNSKNKNGIPHINVAAEGIQERRSGMEVSCGPRGVVHDYVPFYFCSVNPMFLSMLYTKNVDQPLIVILAIPIERITAADVVFTDASANTNNPPNFYEDPEDLIKLDWSAIDSIKWKSKDDDDRHRRMAEVLIYEKVPIKYVEYIIVWNEQIKKRVSEIFEKQKITVPKISFSPFKTKYKFYFTKFMFKGRDGETLITGPSALKSKFEEIVNQILEQRKENDTSDDHLFDDISDCLKKLKANFSAIEELKGILDLETVNDIHDETVSDHTVSVINELIESDYYQNSEVTDKRILKLAAYLHDIGKGPASKWATGKQPAYPDHPVDSLKMLKRILVEDFKNLSKYEIRMICLLVGYHDLIGEILGKGRNEQQLVDIIRNEKEFDMLSALNFADVSAINFIWKRKYSSKLRQFRERILAKISG